MALRCDATADQLSRTTTLPTITTFTMMAWVYRIGTAAAYGTVLAFGTSGASTTNYYAIGTGANGTSLNLYNSVTDATGTTVPQNTWTHLAITVAGTGAGQCLGYFNGVLNITMSGSPSPSAQIIRVGNDNFSEYWNGRLAAVKIYSAVLPVADIANEMLTYVPQRWTNLNSWYPCVDGTVANNALDLSGAGLTMTVGGTLTVEDGPPIAWGITPAWPWGWPSSVSPPPATSRPPRLHPWRFVRRVA